MKKASTLRGLEKFLLLTFFDDFLACRSPKNLIKSEISRFSLTSKADAALPEFSRFLSNFEAHLSNFHLSEKNLKKEATEVR
jgi:hypothetical protein